MNPQKLLNLELFIGYLTEISANRGTLTLSKSNISTGIHFNGARYGIGEVGEFVLIESQQGLILGRIVEIRFANLSESSLTEISKDKASSFSFAKVIFLGSVSHDGSNTSSGVEDYPRLRDHVYAAPHQFLARLASNGFLKGSTIPAVKLEIGSIDVAHDSKVQLTPEKLFGRHCAILGSSGGGKSWTTARIIEESIKHKSKIILLDATGEYRNFNGNEVTNFHFVDPIQPAIDSKQCSLPASCFTEADFISLFEPSGKVQGPKLRDAIRSLKLAKIEPRLATNGIIEKISKPFEDFVNANSDPAVTEKLLNQKQEFDVTLLPKQLIQECFWPTKSEGYGKDKREIPGTWGEKNEADVGFCLSLIGRIEGFLASNTFKCIFKGEETTSLLSFVSNFLTQDNQKLLRICMSGLEYQFNVREIIANCIGRILLNKARHREFLNSPVVVIVDEAHNFLGRKIGSEDTISRLDSFELIAREGRKYGLNICLATQRPRDLTESVLSQIGTLIVHKLTNDRDREMVERACGEFDRSLVSFLPNLQPGEAAIVGADFPIPLTVRVTQPSVKPASDGPNFQIAWGSN